MHSTAMTGEKRISGEGGPPPFPLSKKQVFVTHVPSETSTAHWKELLLLLLLLLR